VCGTGPWDGMGVSETGAPARSAESELAAAPRLALDRRDNGGGGVKRPQ
jgi:hypothetical protein